MENKKTLKISKFELVWYILCGILAVWGLAEIVMGGIALQLGSNVPFRQADETFKSLFGLNMLYWGIILLVMGAVAAVIVLLANAKSSDREFEKNQRRAARLAKDTKPAEAPVVDATVEEVK